MLYESKDELVSHPAHYQSKNGLEVIDVIEAFTDGLNGIEATDTGNVLKYICRWKQKNGIQDLEKILWYTQHLIDYLKRDITEVESVADVDVNLRTFEDHFDLIFNTEHSAKCCFDSLKKSLKTYGIVTIADIRYYLDMAPLPSDFKHGWTDIGHVVLEHDCESLLTTLRLPKAQPLDNKKGDSK